MEGESAIVTSMEEGTVLHVVTLFMIAIAIVVGLYSGSVLLALAAVCGACGVAAMMTAAARPVTQRMAVRVRAGKRLPVGSPWSGDRG